MFQYNIKNKLIFFARGQFIVLSLNWVNQFNLNKKNIKSNKMILIKYVKFVNLKRK